MVEKVGYVIAGTPRTGSNWLCAWLRGCGAGNPREWLNRHQLSHWFRVMEGENPPFVLALKLFWGHLLHTGHVPEHYLCHIQEAMGGARVRWVYLTREDIVRQALSLARVRACGRWIQPVNQGPVQPIPIPYDGGQIQKDIATLQAHREAWQHFFEAQAITPLCVTYEGMQRDVRSVVRAVLAHIGVGVFREVEIPLQKQSGEDVELLVRRYYATDSEGAPGRGS